MPRLDQAPSEVRSEAKGAGIWTGPLCPTCLPVTPPQKRQQSGLLPSARSKVVTFDYPIADSRLINPADALVLSPAYAGIR